MNGTKLSPRTPQEVSEAVRACERVVPRGGGTKDALSEVPPGAGAVEAGGLRGVVEYEPSEFTITALAGTPLADLEAILGENGQYLPFDPPLVSQGATLGGAVAAGLNGPGRYRYGGVRDFVLGVELADGEGQLVRGGGRVVKNAAGFDLPKLLAGSLGGLGVITELCLKVFPRPAAFATLRWTEPAGGAALSALDRLNAASFDLWALELEPPATLVLRVGGSPESLPARIQRLRSFLGPSDKLASDASRKSDLVSDVPAYWTSLRELDWLPEGSWLVKVPLTPRRIAALEAALEALADSAPRRRYSGGGAVAWLAWPEGLGFERLEQLLERHGLSGLVVKGRFAAGRRFSPPRLLLNRRQSVFEERVRRALDPRGRFVWRA